MKIETCRVSKTKLPDVEYVQRNLHKALNLPVEMTAVGSGPSSEMTMTIELTIEEAIELDKVMNALLICWDFLQGALHVNEHKKFFVKIENFLRTII